MAETWRLLDTGLASAARNVALTRALLEARNAEEIPGLLRFVRYTPGVVLGCRQSAAQALDLTECAALELPVQRRLSGGATWMLDERQLGWELYLHRRDVGGADMQAISRRVAHAAAAAIGALGPDARIRGAGEIEVDGRTVCWCAHAAEGDAIVVQGMLLVDIDCERYARILRLPVAARDPGAVAAVRARLASLTEVLGRPPDLFAFRSNLCEAFECEFEIELREGDLGLSEHARYDRALPEIDTAGWADLVAGPASDVCLVEASRTVRGAVLRAGVRFEPTARAIRQVWFSGDACLEPGRALCALEVCLEDLPLHRVTRQVESFFAGRTLDVKHAGPADFVAVVELATGQPLVA